MEVFDKLRSGTMRDRSQVDCGRADRTEQCGHQLELKAKISRLATNYYLSCAHVPSFQPERPLSHFQGKPRS
jgi:hypothetical protein